jgi:Ni/Fe-hydrogenase subunit HybB-like protein
MSQRFPSPEPSDVPIAIVIGSVVGVLAATAYHLLRDHPQYDSGTVLHHFIPEMAAFAAGGAILFAIAAFVLNRRRRKR